ncbi:hypothetical protein JXM67_07425 [candidate division WOR-3 bacterium]|nr:hypothetical protein [candidate division WOR-3 bacterium]
MVLEKALAGGIIGDSIYPMILLSDKGIIGGGTVKDLWVNSDVKVFSDTPLAYSPWVLSNRFSEDFAASEKRNKHNSGEAYIYPWGIVALHNNYGVSPALDKSWNYVLKSLERRRKQVKKTVNSQGGGL